MKPATGLALRAWNLDMKSCPWNNGCGDSRSRESTAFWGSSGETPRRRGPQLSFQQENTCLTQQRARRAAFRAHKLGTRGGVTTSRRCDTKDAEAASTGLVTVCMSCSGPGPLQGWGMKGALEQGRAGHTFYKGPGSVLASRSLCFLLPRLAPTIDA